MRFGHGWLFGRVIALVPSLGVTCEIAQIDAHGQADHLDDALGLIQTHKLVFVPMKAIGHAHDTQMTPVHGSSVTKQASTDLQINTLIPHSADSSHKEPGAPVPYALAITSKIIVTITCVLVFYTFCCACCGYYGVFPRPSVPAVADLDVFREKCRHDREVIILMSMIINIPVLIGFQYAANYELIAVDLGTTMPMVSMCHQGAVIASSFAPLFFGFFCNRVGRKNLILAIVLVEVIGALAAACANSILWFTLARILSGLTAGILPVCLVIVRDLMDDMEERAVWTGAFMIPLALAVSVAPLVGGLMAHFFGWRSGFVVPAVFEAMLGARSCMVLEETLLPKSDAAFSFTKDMMAALRQIANIPIMTLILLMALLGMVGAGIDGNLSIILTDSFGQSQLSTTVLVTGRQVSQLVGVYVSATLLRYVTLVRKLFLSMRWLMIPTIASFFIAMSASHIMWVVYGSFLLSNLPHLVVRITAQTVVLQPLKDVASEAEGIIMCLVTLIGQGGGILSTALVQVVVDEPQFVCLWQGGFLLFASIIFWIFFGWNPPEWAYSESFEENASPGNTPGKSIKNVDNAEVRQDPVKGEIVGPPGTVEQEAF